MPHAPKTYGVAAYAYLRALIAELQATNPELHQRVLKRAVASYGSKPRMGDRAIIQALDELA
jgi:hypothetical protein